MILLTSFDIWEPHHVTNSSDDLLMEMEFRGLLPPRSHLLRRLPVDFQLAPEKVISHIESLQPLWVVCCGMAEKREMLSIEANGKHGEEVLETAVDIAPLVASLSHTEVSQDAGNFVCNYLYYSVLKHIQENQLETQSLFVHVPVLRVENRGAIVQDFSRLLQKLG
jgi:pyroglutamyl-peptidase